MSHANAAPLCQRILDEALIVVRTEGVAQVTMRSLAQRLGYSAATLYLHYRSKDELLRAVARVGFEELIGLAAPRLAQEDAFEAFAAGASCYTDFALAHCELYRLMFDDLEIGALPADDLAPRTRLWSLYSRCYARGMEAGCFRKGDPDLMTLLAWSVMHGFVSLAGRSRLPAPLVRNRSLLELRDGVLREALTLLAP